MKCDELEPLKNIEIAFNTTTNQEQVISEYKCLKKAKEYR
jgi:hypothetical protein